MKKNTKGRIQKKRVVKKSGGKDGEESKSKEKYKNEEGIKKMEGGVKISKK